MWFDVVMGDAGSAEPNASYPYLFYGRAPATWAEGDNFGHRLDLCFVTAPDEPTRRAAEAAFATAVSAGAAVAYRGDCEWRGAWAIILFGARQGDWLDDDDATAEFYVTMWREVADAVAAVHAVLPIREAVNRFVIDHGEEDGWTEWSVRRQTYPGVPPGDSFDYGRVSLGPTPAVAAQALPAESAGPSIPANEDTDRMLLDRLSGWAAGAEPDTEVASSLLAQISARRTAGAVRALLELRSDERPMVRTHVYRALCAFDDDPEALAALRTYLAGLSDRTLRHGDYEYLDSYDGWTIDAIAQGADPALVWDLLSPYVLDFRDTGAHAPVASQVLFGLASLVDEDAIDPRWSEVAFSMIDSPERTVNYTWKLALRCRSERRTDLLVEYAATAAQLRPPFLTALGLTTDPRGEEIFLRHLRSRQAFALAAAGHGLLGLDADRHRAAVVAAVGPALCDVADPGEAKRLAEVLLRAGDATNARYATAAVEAVAARRVHGATAVRNQKETLALLQELAARLGPEGLLGSTVDTR